MKAKWTMILLLAFALLIVPGAVFATNVNPDFALGYSEGQSFYNEYPEYEDEGKAYLDYIRNPDYLIPEEVEDVTSFERGFLDGYYDARRGDVEVNYADELGKSAGSTAALNDFYEGGDSDWAGALPSDRTISRTYNLDRMSSEYKIEFIKVFKQGFKTGYEDSYEKAMMNPPKTSMSQGLSDGQAAGKILGELNAQKDYLLKLRMDYERDILSERDIIDKYRLKLGTAEYIDAFVEGFRSAYEINYNVAFRKTSQTEAVLKTKGIQIGAAGGVLAADGFGVMIEKGTFYMPIYLRIDTMNTSFFKQGPMIRASEIYQVNLDNPAGTMDKTKTIAISFPYYGDAYKAGIYKLVDEKWYYMPSIVEGDSVTAYVNPETLVGRDSIFAVFMDESIRLLTDVRDHWAKDEIETMVRRGIIMGYPGMTALDGTFRPGQGITRAEFLILLSRIENWILPNYIASATYFTDYQTFSTYDRIISYGLNNGYILGYTDRTFRPHNPISYYEVELIMGRVLRDRSFRWNSVATQMMYDKAYKSPSFIDLNRKITRAEVAYMLYTLNEWRY
jgi:hypothetical protein